MCLLSSNWNYWLALKYKNHQQDVPTTHKILSANEKSKESQQKIVINLFPKYKKKNNTIRIFL